MSVLGLEMENSKEKLITMGSSKDQRRMIMRGKRTKRSRPSVVSSSGCSSGGGGENDRVYFSIPSPTSSGENSACTEEDEDMANCLILLAQSGGDNSVKQETTEEIIKAEKFSSSSRKFTETATTTTGKAGFYVYECKTCNRSFTSFQALGGHRASHKKPKAVIEEKKVVVVSSNNNDGQINEGERENVQFNKTSTSVPLHKSSQHNIKPKVHECSICGSEFSSGQALGGHMRRHRSIPTTNINNNIIDENEKPRNILQLDLNLPAPEDIDHRDSKFPFIFSAPALVGCHY